MTKEELREALDTMPQADVLAVFCAWLATRPAAEVEVLVALNAEPMQED